MSHITLTDRGTTVQRDLALNSAASWNGYNTCTQTGSSSGLPNNSSTQWLAVLNVTAFATGSANAGTVTVWKRGATQPADANIHFAAGQASVQNVLTVPVDLATSAKVTIRVDGISGTDSVDITVDVAGYFLAGSTNSSYVPVAPARVADSDSSCTSGLPSGFNYFTSTNQSETLQLQSALTWDHNTACTSTGSSGLPSSGIAAVVLNVTVRASNGANGSPIIVYPSSMGSTPGTTNVSYVSGQSSSNQVVVAVSTTSPTIGQITLTAPGITTGAVYVQVDVQGWYTATANTGNSYVPLATPARIGNTRCTTASPTGFTSLTSSHTSSALQLQTATTSAGLVNDSNLSSCTVGSSGTAGLPIMNVERITAVVLNIEVRASASTDAKSVVTYPTSNSTAPWASDVDFAAGQTRTNQVTVAPDALGSISIATAAITTGSVDLVIDVVGYYSAVSVNSTHFAFTPMLAARIADSNCGSGVPSGFSNLAPNTTNTLNTLGATEYGGADGCTPVGTNGLPSTGVKAVVVRMTLDAFPASSAGELVAWQGSAQPTMRNLYASPPHLFSTEVTVPVDASGNVKFTWSSSGTGSVRLAVDIVGWYGTGASTLFVPLPTSVQLTSKTCGPVIIELRNNKLRQRSLSLNNAPSANKGTGCAAPDSPLSGLPGTGIAAVALTVSVYTPDGGWGSLSLFADDSPPPLATNADPVPIATGLLYAEQDTRASAVTVVPSAAGAIAVAAPTLRGVLKISIDAHGYFVGSTDQVTTIAGTGTAGNTTAAGGIATASQFRAPSGIAVDHYGNVYVSDATSHIVRKIDRAGIVSVVAGNGTACASRGACGDTTDLAPSAQLNQPGGLAVDSAGDLYIADAGDCRIRQVFAENGQTWGRTTSVVGRIYTVAGKESECSTSNPNDLDSPDGVAATSTRFSAAQGLALDQGGSSALASLYVADTGNNRVRRIAPGSPSNSVTFAGTCGTANGKGSGDTGDGGSATSACLNAPSSLGIDGAGNVYIDDRGNNRVRKVSSGNIAAFAGTGSGGHSGDGGAATSATIDSLSGVTADSTGNVIIGEQAAVRLVQGGTIRTVAGTTFQSQGPYRGPARSTPMTSPKLATSNAGDILIGDGQNVVRQMSGVLTDNPYANPSSGATATPKLPVESSIQSSQAAYGNANTGHPSGSVGWSNNWTAGDASYSVQLPSGKVAWFYGDSYLNRVSADHTGGTDTAFGSGGAVTAGQTAFTASNGTFTSNDVGKVITIIGASNTTPNLEHTTYIASVNSSTSITLGQAPTVTVASADYQYATKFPYFVHSQVVLQESATSAVRNNLSGSGGLNGTYFDIWNNSSTNFFWVGAPTVTGSVESCPAPCVQTMLHHEQVVNGELVEPDLYVSYESAVTLSNGFSGPQYTTNPVVQNIPLAVNAANTTDGRCRGNDSNGKPWISGASLGHAAVYNPADDFTYIYGTGFCRQSIEGYLYVARVSGTNLTGSWSYYTITGGTPGWTSSVSTASPLMELGGDTASPPTPFTWAGPELSVTLNGGGFRVVSALGYNYNVNISPQNLAPNTATACAAATVNPLPCPLGPFLPQARFTTAEALSAVRPYNYTNTDTNSTCRLASYNAKEQPALSTNGRIVLSYNVKQDNGPSGITTQCVGSFTTIRDNPDNYRPRFVILGERG